MSGTIFMNKLMEGVSVEWTTLGDEFFLEVANAARRPVKASLRVSGMVPYYGANNIQDYVDGHTHDGEYVLIAEDGSASPENYSVQYATGKFWANNHVHVVRGKEGLNTRFLYHYLCAVDFIPYLPNKDRSKLTKGEMIKIPLPIPCPDNPKKSLEIQAEIARILDAFTELTAGLTAELTARKKQYDYYRDQLLRFDDGDVDWKMLGEVAKYSKTRISFERLEKTNYVGVDNLLKNRVGKSESNYVPTSGNFTEYREGDILIGNIRPYLRKIWQADRAGGTNGDVLVIHPNDTVNARYLFQVLADEKFFEWNMQHAKGAKMPRGNKDKIMEYRFQVPKNPTEQARIAFILDKFETLTNSLADGLPREIALRQKQYAHYRDLLFDFPKPETALAASE